MILLKHSNYSHPPLKSSWIILGPQYILLTITMNSQFDCTLSLPNDRGPTATREEITKNPECLVLEFRNFVTSPPAISTTVQFILLCAIEPPLTPTHINSHLPRPFGGGSPLQRIYFHYSPLQGTVADAPATPRIHLQNFLPPSISWRWRCWFNSKLFCCRGNSPERIMVHLSKASSLDDGGKRTRSTSNSEQML